MEKGNINQNITILTSRQNPIISSLAKLGDKKYRDKEGLFLLDGIKLTLEAAASPLKVEYVLIREDVRDVYFDTLADALPTSQIYVTSASAFERVTDEKAPQGVVAAVRYSDSIKKNDDGELIPYGNILVLDAIQNPDNFGAMLRSARAFGIDGVVCGPGCADIYNRRVMRSSMGAALHIGSIYTSDLAAYCEKLVRSGKRVISAMPSEDASSLIEFEFGGNDAIVIGNEGHGVSDAVLAASSDMVYIPMVKGQESLNAATAAAVIFYEMYRRKLLNS